MKQFLHSFIQNSFGKKWAKIAKILCKNREENRAKDCKKFQFWKYILEIVSKEDWEASLPESAFEPEKKSEEVPKTPKTPSSTKAKQSFKKGTFINWNYPCIPMKLQFLVIFKPPDVANLQ